MVTTQLEYRQRKEDIETYYSLLDEIMNNNANLAFNPTPRPIKHISGDTKVILRSSFFLMLYNCVESTVTNCLRAICDAIKAENCKYSELTNEVQTVVVESYDYLVSSKPTSHENHIGYLIESLGVFCFSYPITLTLDNVIHSTSQSTFSGSLDTKEIRKHFSRFGIDLSDLKCDCLVTVRDKRNQLAHGELSFLECSKDYPIQYLEKMKNSIFQFF